QTAGSLLGSRVRRWWRPYLLWARSDRPVPTRGRLRRPHPQGREARRASGAGADQIRDGHQPQDRQGSRPRTSTVAACPRRRGDRMIRRREFITLFGGVAAWALDAHAQQREQVRRIGVLMNLAPDDAEGQARIAAFTQGLQEANWVVGRNVRIDIRWAAGD